MKECTWIELFVDRLTALKGAGAEPHAIRLLASDAFPMRRELDPWTAAELELDGTTRPAARAPRKRQADAGRRKFIIVADDYDDSAKVVAGLLEGASTYEAESATDGDEALLRSRIRRPDAVLLDIEMPRVGGIEAARAFRAMYPEQRPLLIAMTSRSQAIMARESGMFDHLLLKPVDFQRLFSLLDEEA